MVADHEAYISNVGCDESRILVKTSIPKELESLSEVQPECSSSTGVKIGEVGLVLALAPLSWTRSTEKAR